MFGILAILFILVPIAEISLLIEIGRQIGSFSTIFLVILTGIVGAYLTRTQGFQIWFQIRNQFHRGEFPANSLIEGLLVLVGGLTLLTPGFITDSLGLLCLIPPTRKLLREVIKNELGKRIETPQRNTTKHDAVEAEFWVEEDKN